MIPAGDPSEPCDDAETVQFLRQVREHAERGDEEWLKRHGTVYVGRRSGVRLGGRPVRLLRVENHAAFTRLAGREFLASHEVTVVPSLAAARTALAAGTFDAVLVDYDLDDGKGAELVEAIRRLPDRLLVVAASSHEDGNAALMAAGADVVCSKLRFAGIDAVLRSITGER